VVVEGKKAELHQFHAFMAAAVHQSIAFTSDFDLVIKLFIRGVKSSEISPWHEYPRRESESELYQALWRYYTAAMQISRAGLKVAQNPNALQLDSSPINRYKAYHLFPPPEEYRD
jgi:hypothetical protein